jgi:F0F1-type ATP synthase assembly protein I
MNQLCKKLKKYFSKYPLINALIHVCVGVGLGFLLTYPVAGIHPVRWGVVFLTFGLIGHVVAATHK